jgi:hypothetical protein
MGYSGTMLAQATVLRWPWEGREKSVAAQIYSQGSEQQQWFPSIWAKASEKIN